MCQQIFTSLESVAQMACGSQHLADQIGLAAVIVEYNDSHDVALIRICLHDNGGSQADRKIFKKWLQRSEYFLPVLPTFSEEN